MEKKIPDIIQIHSQAFYELVAQVIAYIKKSTDTPSWVDTETAMKILNIRSKNTLQKLRDEGKIVYSKTTAKNILYDINSLYAYIQQNKTEVF